MTSTLKVKDEHYLNSALEEALEEGTGGRHFDTSIASCLTYSTDVLAGVIKIES